jgi:short-subunit dehydrogenase
VAFITGASSGIGAATAIAFAREGAHCVLLARRMEKLEETRKAVEAEGVKCLALACDVCDRGALDAAVAKTVALFGGIDIVLANAGFGVSGAATKLETDDFRRQFETNVFGLLDTVYATLPQLEKNRGRLGLIGSVMGRVNFPASGPYCASKFAVVSIAECLYFDLADLGISVTAINPGLVASEIRSVNNKGDYTGKPDPAPAFLVMPTEKAARQIVSALYRRKPELIITKMAILIIFLNRHFPRTVRFATRLGSKGKLHKVEAAKRGKGDASHE